VWSDWELKKNYELYDFLFESSKFVIPAEAGIQFQCEILDSHFRGNDSHGIGNNITDYELGIKKNPSRIEKDLL
jgi:hypothetical protein